MSDLEYFSLVSPLPDYPNYRVSTHGRVLSLWGREPRVLKQDADKDGYLIVGLCNGSQKKMKAHRLVALAFLDNPDALPQVDHINQDKKDNRLVNLRWASAKDNLRNQSKIVAGCVTYRHGGKKRPFRARYCTAPGKQGSKCFATREEAEVFLVTKRRRHKDPYHDV